MRRTLAAATIAALLPLTACSPDDPAPPAAKPAPAVTSSAAPRPSTNVETDTACKLVDEAMRSQVGGGLDDRATIEAIVLNATKSNIDRVKLAGVQMDGRYSAWSRAGGDAE